MPKKTATAKDEFVYLKIRWAESRVDTLGYKPYSPLLTIPNVFIRIPVPNTPKYVVSAGKGEIVLTLDGWGYAQAEAGKVFQRINPNLK